MHWRSTRGSDAASAACRVPSELQQALVTKELTRGLRVTPDLAARQHGRSTYPYHPNVQLDMWRLGRILTSEYVFRIAQGTVHVQSAAVEYRARYCRTTTLLSLPS